MSLSGSSFKARGMSLHNLVSLAFEGSPVRLAASSPRADETYEVSILIPKSDRSSLLSLLRQSLDATFGLKVRREKRNMEVLILKSSKDLAKLLRPSKHNQGMPILSDEGLITSEGTAMRTFCSVLENGLRKVVLDETGLKGLYDIALYWDPDNPDSVLTAVIDQLGLELIKEKRAIDVTVFETSFIP
jgi:uncharacterized protein (TIGR03435 family)